MIATLICGTLTIAVVVASFFAGRRSLQRRIITAYLIGLRDGAGLEGFMKTVFQPTQTIKGPDKITAKDLGLGMN